MRRPDLKFVLAGSGPRVTPLRALAADLPNVILPGWLESQEVHNLMHISTFGLIRFKSASSFMMSFPNKFSEYLAGGLVVACALEGEMSKLVRQSNCGFVDEEGNAENLAESLAQTLQDTYKIEAMAKAATNLHRTRFDGAEIYPKFADYLEIIATSKR